MACFLNQAVLLHLELKEVRIAGRGVGDGIGTSCNGGFDTFLAGTAGGHDGKIRVAFPNLRYDLGRLAPPLTLRISTPASILEAISALSETTV